MKPIVPVSARGERSPSGRDQTRLTGLDVMRGGEEKGGEQETRRGVERLKRKEEKRKRGE